MRDRFSRLRCQKVAWQFTNTTNTSPGWWVQCVRSRFHLGPCEWEDAPDFGRSLPDSGRAETPSKSDKNGSEAVQS